MTNIILFIPLHFCHGPRVESSQVSQGMILVGGVTFRLEMKVRLTSEHQPDFNFHCWVWFFNCEFCYCFDTSLE